MDEQKEEIEALFLIKDSSLLNQKKILVELNSLLGECTQDLHDNKIEFDNAGLFEKLLFQIVYHNETILNLTSGTSINVRNKKIEINDLTAVYSIARLQIETFINLSYVFFIDCNYSIEIRASVYKIHGLRKQIELNKKHSKNFSPIQKMRNELAEELMRIRKLDKFKNLPNSKRKRFINPTYARLLKPDEIYPLIKIGDLSRIHNLYSNHIHSEYISIRQLKSAIKDGKQNERSFSTVLLLCSRMTALVITNLNSKYQLEKNSYSKATSKLKRIVESLNKISGKL